MTLPLFCPACADALAARTRLHPAPGCCALCGVAVAMPAGLDASPLAGVLREVVGVDGHLSDLPKAYEAWRRAANESVEEREAMVRIARAVLAGIQACDAAAGPRGEEPSR